MRLSGLDFKHPEPCTLAERFENSLLELRTATDSRGLRVCLHSGNYSSVWLRKSLHDFVSKLDPRDMVFVNLDGTEDLSGEPTFARNLQLLTNAYVASLAYERASGG